MDDLILRLEDDAGFTLTIDDSVDMTLTLQNYGWEVPTYEGETIFIPKQEERIVLTKNKMMLDNITIRPIPENYGLITYNGGIITVS